MLIEIFLWFSLGFLVIVFAVLVAIIAVSFIGLICDLIDDFKDNK